MAKRTSANAQTRKRANSLSHLDAAGRAKMVDVSAKPTTVREAVARGEVRMRTKTLELIRKNQMAKGHVLAVAQVAGVLAAKRADEFIPLAHPLPLSGIDITFSTNGRASAIGIEARVRTAAQTGVEMEALAAVAAAALAIYDMCKAADREMTIGRIRLVQKSGGRRGDYRRKGEG
ncbi:MAG TPA: cyclic pyranopterin monophosphate synthase MoaC [bacterium]|nr:cyclic pyranopterin monophosphate synthase MoaC [bacterium]